MHEVESSGVGSCFKEEAEVIQTAANSVFSFELAGASAARWKGHRFGAAV